MKLIIAIFFTLFSGSAFAADGYFGAKYEATYVDWGKVESLDLDEILGTTLNIFDIHYGRESDNRFIETGVFFSDTADMSHNEYANLAGTNRLTITADTEHSIYGARVGVGARKEFWAALSLTATANARFAQQEVQLNNTTILGSSTFEKAAEGDESGFMADVGLGISFNTGDALFDVALNGYVATIGDIDDMGSISASLTVPF